MKLLYTNPLSLAFHYLTLWFYGTPLTSLHTEFSLADKKVSSESPPFGSGGDVPQIFDFIIAGGGSAGCTLSARLSEDGKYSVLLLEAGGNPFPTTSVPAIGMLNLGIETVDWYDKVVPQAKANHALVNNSTPFNRGKGLGGSSLLNAMLYQRGCPKDFDNWAKETNDSQWSFENVLPYFRKLENYNGQFMDETFHGTNGPLYISQQSSYGPMVKEWLDAGMELGYKVKDPNGYQTESFFPFETTTKEGTRFHAHRAFIFPNLRRKNLKIQTYSHVTKVKFDKDMRALGVTYMKDGKEYFVEAKKEVILSSGSIGSPQILMLSGVGPKSHLESKGIPCKLNLPVGQNLQDHLMSLVGPFFYQKNLSSTANLDMTFNEDRLHEYLANNTGLFSAQGISAGAFGTTTLGTPGWPDVYYTMCNLQVSPFTADALQRQYDVKPGVKQKYYKDHVGKAGFMVAVVVGLPKTMGEVTLRSPDPLDRVDINPKYFEQDHDLQVMLEGAKFVVKLVEETKAMKGINAKLTDTPFPGCESFPDRSSKGDEYWKCFVKNWSSTMWHMSSTCRMGTSPQNSVVDSNLRVHGAKNLRVVDLSTMPKVTNANTNLPTIMIAEKAADMIKSSWKDKS